MSNREFCLAEAVRDAQDDLLLLRLCLTGMLESHPGQTRSELRCLRRIADYLEQHIGDISFLLPEKP